MMLKWIPQVGRRWKSKWMQVRARWLLVIILVQLRLASLVIERNGRSVPWVIVIKVLSHCEKVLSQLLPSFTYWLVETTRKPSKPKYLFGSFAELDHENVETTIQNGC
ncbi:unnamed protein product [Linum tenue]|uniref:Secreted protein n=1 Tax=Linum tenue TaxID=586396 RepID=A0AAV0H9Y9_9ROSI|nr:unnamed protein product [Linum tenue]